ncbi:MAG: DUF485 domain-containing protein [Rubrobacteraceae bacterium]
MSDDLARKAETTAREWRRVEFTPAFQELRKKRKKFIIPATIFFFAFYFLLIVLAAYTTFMNVEVIGALTWAYIYAYAQFFMTWILMHLYLSRANKWDDLVDRSREQAARGEEVEAS